MIQYCKCGSIMEFGICSNRRCPERDSRHREWIVGGMLLRYPEPVTRKEAEEQAGQEALLQAVKARIEKYILKQGDTNDFMG